MKKIVLFVALATIAIVSNAQFSQSCKVSLKMRYKWNSSTQNCEYTGKLFNICAKLVCGAGIGKLAKPDKNEILSPYTLDLKNNKLICEFTTDQIGVDAQAVLKEKKITIQKASQLVEPSAADPTSKGAARPIVFSLKPGDYKIETTTDAKRKIRIRIVIEIVIEKN